MTAARATGRAAPSDGGPTMAPVDPPSAPGTTASDVWIVTACAVVATVGLSGDIARHLQSGTSITGDFFASWHLVLYGGVTGLAAYLGRLALVHGPQAMKAAFGPTVAGVFVLGAGGAGDFAWHEAFGVEVDIPALLSPPHLLLLLGLVLVALGPIAALWRSAGDRLSWSSSTIVGLCAACVITVVMLFTGYLSVFSSDVVVNGYANPMVGTRLTPTETIHGVATLLWSSLVLTSPWLLLRLRWRLPTGMLAATFAVLAITAAVAVPGVADEIVVAALIGGAVIDGVLHIATRNRSTDHSLLATAVAIPVVLWTFTFLALLSAERLEWGASLWVGGILLSTFTTSALAGMLVLARRTLTR